MIMTVTRPAPGKRHFTLGGIAPPSNICRARGAAGYSANYYGHGHGYRYWPYAAAGAYAYGGSRGSSDDGCYYVSTAGRSGTRRVLVCPGN